MRLTVSGGCGYIGSVLVPKLLSAGHVVRVLDIQWFGNYLKEHEHLKVIRGDIRDESFPLGATDAVIHLAAVANDPQGDLEPRLTWEINALATMQLADRAARQGVKQFIYASSGSVYGVSNEPEVTEDLPLVPLSEYNKTKMVAERAVLSYVNRMAVQILRPGTVCGMSPRMRLDGAVNAITMQALMRGGITIQGGKQHRPNIHIEDMTDLYLWMLERPELSGIYNAGFQNLTISRIASMVAQRLAVPVVALPSNDPRSYRINSDKLLATGFEPKRTVRDAIDEIIARVKAGTLRDEPQWHNVTFMPNVRKAA